MFPNLSVIGVGNMARAIVMGMLRSDHLGSNIFLYDKNPLQYEALPQSPLLHSTDSLEDAICQGDYVLLAVKPQNYDEVLRRVACLENHVKKIYISIAAGIAAQSVSDALGGACVIRVLPNVPMLIGKGVSVICRNDRAPSSAMSFVDEIFKSAGSNLFIDESEMNRIIGVTSSSPAYVFRFIESIYQAGLAQGLPDHALLDAVCDVVIGSAQLLKESGKTPDEMISMVASKGGTTEQAIRVLTEGGFQELILQAMVACTKRAEELGKPQ